MVGTWVGYDDGLDERLKLGCSDGGWDVTTVGPTNGLVVGCEDDIPIG
jgi:hypothetical protein